MIISNGEVRQRVYDGKGKGSFEWVFAGNARMSFNEGVLRDRTAMELGNFDFITQATRRNKIKEKKNGYKGDT